MAMPFLAMTKKEGPDCHACALMGLQRQWCVIGALGAFVIASDIGPRANAICVGDK